MLCSGVATVQSTNHSHMVRECVVIATVFVQNDAVLRCVVNRIIGEPVVWRGEPIFGGVRGWAAGMVKVLGS